MHAVTAWPAREESNSMRLKLDFLNCKRARCTGKHTQTPRRVCGWPQLWQRRRGHLRHDQLKGRYQLRERWSLAWVSTHTRPEDAVQDAIGGRRIRVALHGILSRIRLHLVLRGHTTTTFAAGRSRSGVCRAAWSWQRQPRPKRSDHGDYGHSGFASVWHLAS